MKPQVGGLALLVAIFLAFPLQEFIPPLHMMHGARVLLVPMLFCYGALALPTWAGLILAALTGLMHDKAIATARITPTYSRN